MATILAAAGCEHSQAPRQLDCLSPVRATVAPADTGIPAGQIFTPRLSIVACGGDGTATDVPYFVAEDETILSVNRESGQIGAIRPGESDVFVHGERYGLLTKFHVTVFQAAPVGPSASSRVDAK